ncbi:MAG: DUF4012 domain-containing protein [Actinomycetota bacterium]
MSLSLEPVEPQADIEPVPPPKRRHVLRWVLLAVVVLAIGLACFAVWLATGLKSAAAAIKAPATAARADLTTMKTALQNGDQESAKTSLASAHVHLRAAEQASHRQPVKIAGGLPVLSQPVSDLKHLLSAATDLVSAGDRVVALYEDVSGKDSKLFKNSAFDLAALHNADSSVMELMSLLDRAEGDLKQVRGGRFAPGAREASDSALLQITGLRKDAKPLVDILGVLPAALGEQTKKCYLVTLQNQAELRAGGGAPLSLTAACFDKGAMNLLPTRQTLETDKNAALQWTAVPGNEAWHAPGVALPFASANFAPDWPTSGEELLRAYEVMESGSRADGVIGMDVTAMAAVLKSTGTALPAGGYGDVSGDTLAQTLLIDSYRKYDVSTRHTNNAELMSRMVSRLIGGGGLAGKFRALASTSPGHHMQMYFRDKALQALVQPTPMAGRLDPGNGDFLGVYTTNTNASKVDVYQSRTIKQDVSFAADGSAQVTRTTTIVNNSPGYRPSALYPVDPGHGYATTFSRPILATYVPPGARVRGFLVTGSVKATISPREYATDRNMRVLRVWANLPRTHSLTATLKYLGRPAAQLDGYHLRIASQATLAPTEVTLSVAVPTGYVATPTPGWVQTANRWTTTLSVIGDVDIFLPFTRG